MPDVNSAGAPTMNMLASGRRTRKAVEALTLVYEVNAHGGMTGYRLRSVRDRCRIFRQGHSSPRRLSYRYREGRRVP